MSMAAFGARTGTTTGNVLIVLSILTVGAAMAYPRIEGQRHEARVDEAMTTVETVRAAAMEHFAEHRSWPDPAASGLVPSELEGVLPAGLTFSHGDYTLEWRRWESVVIPPDPVLAEVGTPDLNAPVAAIDSAPPTPPARRS